MLLLLDPGGGGYTLEIWVGMCGQLLETLALFLTKMCDFPYLISDLTQNSIPYFRPTSRLVQAGNLCIAFEEGDGI